MKKIYIHRALALLAGSIMLTGLVVAATSINLGRADTFAVLAGSGITVSGAVNTTTITGDIGTFPTVSITGLGNVVLNGINHTGDATTQGGKTDLVTAYGLAVGQTPVTIPTELGGSTRFAGVYDSLSGTFGITGDLILDAQGNPNAVFIFKTASSLLTAGASRVILINGAQACNVFWQVGSSATLGADSVFKGNILALTSITLGNRANVEGRVLAQNGTVTLDANTVTRATCIIPPVPPVPTVPYNEIGGVYSVPWVAPIINVIKVPTPLALPSGPGVVTYDYTVTNIGTVHIENVMVTDNMCSPVSFISGDTNSDLRLDVNEIWKYRCSSTLTQTTANTVTATGKHDFFTALDTANAIVVVGASSTPPLINITKRANVTALPSTGGNVTYTYTVTNPGTVALSDVSVADNQCTGLPGRVIGHPGDLNNNNLLESNESWSFTCQTNLTKTTTNTGIAEGHANGLTAIDFSLATVVVVSPSLPNTGLPVEENNNFGKIIVTLLVIFSAAMLLLITRRRLAH